MMRLQLLALVIHLAGGAYAQDCADGRFVTFDHFADVTITTGVQFGSNTGVFGTPQNLLMDVYEPAGDLAQDRPVVIVAFGGSFITGSRADVAPLCQAFARMGYVAVAPDYRVGFFFPNASTTSQAVMRGAHDMKACVRYLRKTVAENENPYRIDPDRIIVGGASAGAISALHATYLDEPEEFPAILADEFDQLGGIEGNSGNAGYSSDVFACYSFSGALGDTTWIQPGDQPLASVHEMGDEIVPYYTQEVSVIGIATGLTASGSHDIHLRMEHLDLDNCLLSYDSDTHVGYLNSDPAFSVGHVGQFLADLICGPSVSCGNLATSVAEASPGPEFSIQPNPTNGPLRIDLPAAGTITVFDASGRSVLQQRLPIGASALDLATWPNGLYLLRVDVMPGKVVRVVKAD